MPPHQRQINVRLPTTVVGTIEAAAILEELSIAEYLKPVLEGLADSLKEDPSVQTIIRLRAERAAQKEGKLSPIGSKRRVGGTSQ
jgi:hypothetical protein